MVQAILAPNFLERPKQRFFNRSMGNYFDVHAENDVVDLQIYDEIGFFGVNADDFRRKLNSFNGKRINLDINSPGGDVFDGIAIHNDLLSHDADVNVRVSGLAASAASVIAMAGDSIEIGDNAFMMIHNAWALALGDKSEMRAMGDVLDKIDGSLAKTYARRTGGDVDDIAEMMNAETWMDGSEAVEAGFADAVSGDGGDAPSALFDLSVFNNVPAELKRRTENSLRDAGYTKREARAAVADGFHVLGRRDADRGLDRRDAGDGYDEVVAALNSLTSDVMAATR